MLTEALLITLDMHHSYYSMASLNECGHTGTITNGLCVRYILSSLLLTIDH